MGMYATLRRATAADAERLRADPALVAPFLFGEAPGVVEDRLPGCLGFLVRLTPIRVERVADAPATPGRAPAWPEPGPGGRVELDKAWHGVHYLLTGAADGGPEPASYLLSGGEEIGDDDDVPARLLSPAQLREFAAVLGALTREELTRRFDPARMTALDVYPRVIWQRPEETDRPLGFLLDAFDELRDFARAAAEAGDGAVVCIQ